MMYKMIFKSNDFNDARLILSIILKTFFIIVLFHICLFNLLNLSILFYFINFNIILLLTSIHFRKSHSITFRYQKTDYILIDSDTLTKPIPFYRYQPLILCYRYQYINLQKKRISKIRYRFVLNMMVLLHLKPPLSINWYCRPFL